VPTSKQEEKAAHSLLRCSSLHPDPISSDPAEMRLQLFGEKPPDIESFRANAIRDRTSARWPAHHRATKPAASDHTAESCAIPRVPLGVIDRPSAPAKGSILLPWRAETGRRARPVQHQVSCRL